MEAIRYPELVFGIAGAMGIDIEAINNSIESALLTVGYRAIPIRITTEVEGEITNVPKPIDPDFGADVTYKMDHAKSVCDKYQSASTLMRFAIRAIRSFRAKEYLRGSKPILRDEEDEIVPEEQVLPKTAFVIRQLKRPDEVRLLRSVYGKQFILLSAYGSIESRRAVVETNLRRTLPLNVPDHEIKGIAERLISKDHDEQGSATGQHLRDTYHMADVFVDGITKSAMDETIGRFVRALFGKADIAPSKDEYGMYAAKSASLRSSDLSRQIGAAIFSEDGEVIAQGCNEVPKAFGGTYWDGESPDHRDVKIGHDPNEVLKREVLRDTLERLINGGMLSDAAMEIGGAQALIDALTQKPKTSDAPRGYGCLVDSQITDLTEYGRVVHAEMCAICDAARLGKSVKGARLYTTTFPCHNCTKHILAAGLKKVVYMEPYPKSKAKELHYNEVSIEEEEAGTVAFMPFLGISPLRYRDVFEKGRRKSNGKALEWVSGEPRPMINISAPAYVDLETYELALLDGAVETVESEHKSA